MQSINATALGAAEKVKALVRDGGACEASQVGLIGLEAVREAAGANWARIGARIREGALARIHKHLSPNDAVVPAGDGFLILYEQRPGRDFAAERRAVQAELNQFYLGEEATQRVRVEVNRTTLDPEQLLRSVSAPPDAEPSAPAIAAQTPAPAPIAAEPRSAQLPLALLPIWHVTAEALTAYWLTPLSGHGAQRQPGYSEDWLATGSSYGADFLDLDLALLREAVNDAQFSLANRRRCLIEFSVHSSTLMIARRRAEYMNQLSRAPAAVRPYLMARVAEFELGAPLSRMAECVYQLRSVSQRVTVQLHESDRARGSLDDTGAFAVAFALAQGRQFSKAGQSAYASLIGKWAQALKRRNVRLRLDNVLNLGLIETLADGVEFVTSPTLWPIVAEPEGVRVYKQDQLLRDVLRLSAAPPAAQSLKPFRPVVMID